MSWIFCDFWLASSRTQQSSNVRSFGTPTLSNTGNQNFQQRRTVSSRLFGTPSVNTVPESRSLRNFQSFGATFPNTAPGSRSLGNSQSFRTPSLNTGTSSRSQQQQSRNSSVDVQIDDFLSTLDALIAAESAARGVPNSQNFPPTSGFAPANTASFNTPDTARGFNNAPASSPTLNDFTLPTSLPG